MKASQDDYLILPDGELRDIYKHDRRVIWFISLPMFPLVYLIVITVIGTLTLDAEEAIVAVAGIGAFVCYSAIFADSLETNKRLRNGANIFQLVMLAIGVVFFIMEGRPFVPFIQAGFIVGTNLANRIAQSYIEDISVLKAHPRYPFDNWRRDESYTSSLYTNGTSYSDRAAKRLDSTLNAGKVRTVGGEEFLEGEQKKFELPKPDPEKNLQQRTQVWRQHSKSDTGYTMDNLKNMYFDAVDEGELSGRELERELMKATAPKKAPEPTPEDFFQQSPVIWRKNKDGTTTIEHRAPGSAPADDTSGRTVLP